MSEFMKTLYWREHFYVPQVSTYEAFLKNIQEKTVEDFIANERRETQIY